MADDKKIKEFSQEAASWGKKHITLLKGLGALLFGIALLYSSRLIFVQFIVFACGLLLIYYGLKELKLKKATDFIDKIVTKIRK